MKKNKLNYHEKYDSFYQTKEWKELRNRKWYDSNGLCEMCKSKGIIKEAKEIHHIEPIEKNWDRRLDYDNLISLCSDCHNAQHERISPLQQFLQIWNN